MKRARLWFIFAFLSIFSTPLASYCLASGANSDATGQSDATFLELLQQDARLAEQRAEAYQQIVIDIDKHGGATPKTVERILNLAHERAQQFLLILNRLLEGKRFKNAIDLGQRVAGDIEEDIETGAENEAKNELMSKVRQDLARIYEGLSDAYKGADRETERDRALLRSKELTAEVQ